MVGMFRWSDGGVVRAAASVAAMFLFSVGSASGQNRPGGPAAPAADSAALPPITLPAASDAKTLETFISGLIQGFQTRGAQFRTDEATIAQLNRIERAMAELQTRKLDESAAALVAQVRRDVLEELLQLDAEEVIPRMKQLLGVLQSSEHAALRRLGGNYTMMVEIRESTSKTPADRTALVEKISARLREPLLPRDAINLAQTLAEEFEYAELYAEAAAAYEAFAKAVEARNEPQLADLVEMMRGSGRRVGLVGNPIQLKGTTLDGQPFDIASWKGKVVLIDFWATWCGPCLQEIPNVKRNYALYHDKGFEVVGISLDDKPADVHAFLQQQPLPWTTLYPPNPQERGMNHPLVKHYGLSGIPAVFLVNQEGKVVSIDVRGEELGEHLAKLLGPAPGAGAPPPAPTNDPGSN